MIKMLHPLLFGLPLITLTPVSATSLPRAPDNNACSATKPQIATFDNIPSGNIITGSVASIGIYQNISWNGFEPFCTTDPPPVVVVPNSGSCEAAAGPLVTASILDGEDIEMTVNYTGSTFACFDIQSLYFGCALPLKNAAADPPTDCDVTFEGYDGAGRLVATQTESFDVGLVALEPVDGQLVRFSEEFRGLARLRFEIENTALGVLGLATGTVIDTVSYTVYGAEDGCCPTW